MKRSPLRRVSEDRRRILPCIECGRPTREPRHAQSIGTFTYCMRCCGEKPRDLIAQKHRNEGING